MVAATEIQLLNEQRPAPAQMTAWEKLWGLLLQPATDQDTGRDTCAVKSDGLKEGDDGSK
jgi:hypothetical protein